MNTTENHRKKWTEAEDQRLLRQVKAFPQNLTHCFAIVSQEIGRTEGAVSNHWYNTLSKKPEVLCFFTASPKHISRNRKNGVGEEISRSFWQRLVRLISSFHL